MTKIKQKMNEVLDSFQQGIAALRTDRVNPAMLQNIKVNIQGQFMPINHLGHISVMDYSTLCVRVWDSNNLSAIEAAIGNSALGIIPKINDQEVIVSIPPMSNDRRKEICKILMDMSEQTKIKIRNLRRHNLDQLRNECKSGEITEDDLIKMKQDLQSDTDDCIKRIDQLIQSKKQEIMTV